MASTHISVPSIASLAPHLSLPFYLYAAYRCSYMHILPFGSRRGALKTTEGAPSEFGCYAPHQKARQESSGNDLVRRCLRGCALPKSLDQSGGCAICFWVWSIAWRKKPPRIFATGSLLVGGPGVGFRLVSDRSHTILWRCHTVTCGGRWSQRRLASRCLLLCSERHQGLVHIYKRSCELFRAKIRYPSHCHHSRYPTT